MKLVGGRFAAPSLAPLGIAVPDGCGFWHAYGVARCTTCRYANGP